MTEPVTTISGAVTSALTAIKDFPLWLLIGVALSLIAFLSIPELSAAVQPETRVWLNLGAVAFTILAVSRLGSLVISQINSYRARLEARRTFHLTPTLVSFWNATRQKDGTIVTQIRAMMLAKNRTDKILHLLRARVIRPDIPGEVLHVFINAAADSSYGIPTLSTGEPVLVSVDIMIRGFPGRVRENLSDLAAVLAIEDDEGSIELGVLLR